MLQDMQKDQYVRASEKFGPELICGSTVLLSNSGLLLEKGTPVFRFWGSMLAKGWL